MLHVLPDLVRLQRDQSVAQLVNGYIKDERLRQVFSFHPLLVGGNPFQSTSIYALIHTLEQQWGVWFAMGGTGALVRALVRLFEELGGELRLECRGRRDRGRRARRAARPACGSPDGDAHRGRRGGEQRRRRVDVHAPRAAGASPARTPTAAMSRLRYSMSLFVIYFGTDRRYDDVAHHEILMGPRYRGLLDDIFTQKTLADDFSLYLHRPTATDPSLAPPGCDSWYVLSPVPHLGGSTDWRQAAQAVSRPHRRRISRSATCPASPGTSSPSTRSTRCTSATRSTATSAARSRWSRCSRSRAWFRPHNRSEDIANLYFAGAGTHPGAGLPGVLSSGKIVAELIGAGEPMVAGRAS